MLERKPFADIQNDAITNRKVQRTYGKRGKNAALTAAKGIFTMTNEVENALERLHINGDEERKAKSEVAGSERRLRAIIKDASLAARMPGRAEGVIYESTSLPETEAQQISSLKTARRAKPANTPASAACLSARSTQSASQSKEPTPDDKTIQSFALKYSDRKILTFQSYGHKIAKAYSVRKIGEGAYSSVFALTRKGNESCSQDTTAILQSSNETGPHGTTILKMMPILLPSMSEVEGRTEPFHIANELQTMQLMDSIHGFIRYRGLTIVQGQWPENFLSAFRKFRTEHRKKAENEDPEEAYSENQYYALIEMEDAGSELSDVLKRPSDFQMWDVIWQTCIYLAHAEGQCGFEHRDLHVSNLCIKPGHSQCQAGGIDVDRKFVEHMSSRPTYLLGSSNIDLTLIDYTFSRAELMEYDEACGKGVNFREFLIEGEEYDVLLKRFEREAKKIGNSGDKFEDRMQQLTYAKVAKCVRIAREEIERSDQVYDKTTGRYMAPWEHFVPLSNVCWLGYLVACLLGRAGKTGKTKYVAGSNEVARLVQDDIRQKLIQMKNLLLDEDIDQMPRSADDFLRIGIEKDWITREEIEAFKLKLEQQS